MLSLLWMQIFPSGRNDTILEIRSGSIFELFEIFEDPSDVETAIEIEWEAKQTDGFAKRTFDDLHKLSKIGRDNWGMFLAVNIGNKYKRAKRGTIFTTTNAATFFNRGPRHTFLQKEWNKEEDGEGRLLRCNPRFWRWYYDKRCDVTVLTCFGRRTSVGWSSR